MTKAIGRSPVLSDFGIQIRFLRGRFYVERPTPSGIEVWGRITPLTGDLLLEVEQRSWNEVARGSAQALVRVIADDHKGTFHGLGSLDRSLREVGHGINRLPVKLDGNRFVYVDSGKGCGVQEVLFHFFGLPIAVIAEPRVWYAYHRTPQIIEFSEDQASVLVRFSATSMSGESFGGTCLYAQREGRWDAYPIKPSESGSIATAKRWLVKRKWEPWC